MENSFGKLNKNKLREVYNICKKRDNQIDKIWMDDIFSFDNKKIEECYDKYDQYICDNYGQEYIDFIKAKAYFDSLDEEI